MMRVNGNIHLCAERQWPPSIDRTKENIDRRNVGLLACWLFVDVPPGELRVRQWGGDRANCKPYTARSKRLRHGSRLQHTVTRVTTSLLPNKKTKDKLSTVLRTECYEGWLFLIAQWTCWQCTRMHTRVTREGGPVTACALRTIYILWTFWRSTGPTKHRDFSRCCRWPVQLWQMGQCSSGAKHQVRHPLCDCEKWKKFQVIAKLLQDKWDNGGIGLCFLFSILLISSPRILSCFFVIWAPLYFKYLYFQVFCKHK